VIALCRYECGYTGDVKIAISLPDELYREAEFAAKRLKVSRSQLYATALATYLEQQGGRRVTEQLNAIYGARTAKVDPALNRMQLASLPEKW
jgi:metal-responsive CopG/Arc/MetJ family transcriptional regulator